MRDSITQTGKMCAQFNPRHILVVVKPCNFPAAHLGQEIACWLEARGCRVDLLEGGGAKPDLRQYAADMALVLGGDGTLLGVARALVENPVPLLGLNFGKVGFLAELHADDWKQGLERVLDGRCRVHRRMALGWRVVRREAVVSTGHAINDVVLSRGALSRVIALNVEAVPLTTSAEVDEDLAQHICLVRADGLIISSPLGSSGYAVSAGGPLVSPDLNAMTVLPICPFLCHFPPIVLPSSYAVRAVVQTGSVETFLTSDGQEGLALESGDAVEVYGVEQGIHLARVEAGAYFKRLKGRGFIEEFSGMASSRG